jgi:hypothetical protein
MNAFSCGLVYLVSTAFIVTLRGAEPVKSVEKSEKAAKEETTINLKIIDKVSGKAIPARVHLKGPDGKPVQPPKLPYWRDHFACNGEVKLELPLGIYSYEIERGPEFSVGTGKFIVERGGRTNVTAPMVRIVDLTEEGWWSGETHVHRPPADAELLMRSEDLHVAEVITWWQNRGGNKTVPIPEGNPLHAFDTNRFYHLLAGEDERNGGALLFFNLDKPLEMSGAKAEVPSSVVFATEAKKHAGVWIDMEKPFWWDFPLWVASGLCDSVGLANNHMNRLGMMDNEAWGKARDIAKFPSPRGNGLWSQDIYYHMLNCGIRIPPSAGSASGVLPNPVGYNRAYVHVDGPLTYEKWWEGMRAGRVFVSNGPLLRCKANGEWPGHVFKSDGRIDIKLGLQLTSREPISALEVIQDGKVVHTKTVGVGDHQLELGTLNYRGSGWFLVRAISTEQKTFRFASTGPFYVEVGKDKTSISKASAQFFVDWVKERKGRIDLPAGTDRDGVMEAQGRAEKFWNEILERANVD